MPRGGYHPNAERWGRKSAWLNASNTKTIRVPGELAEQILSYAHKLDEGEVIDYDTKAKQENEQSTWLNTSDTKTIRVPGELAEKILDYGHKLDKGEVIDYDTKAKQENEQLRQQLAACQVSQPTQLDLEGLRDRFLASLRVGKQSPEYKRNKTVIDRFIAFARSD